MKVALVGCTGHIDYLLQGLERLAHVHLSGFATGFPDEDCKWFIESQQKILGFVVYDTYKQLLDEEKPNVLCIASFIPLNGEIVLEAVRRGIHVFVEKPVASTLQELESIRKELQNTKVHLAAMHAYRYYPVFQAVYECIQEGIIGDPVLITAQKSYKFGAYLEQHGSTIPWIGPHMVDWIIWLTGKKVTSVYGSQSRAGNRNEQQSEAAATVLLNMENGATAVIYMDFLQPADSLTYSDDRLRIAGTKGIIEINNGKAFLQIEERTEISSLEEHKEMFVEFISQVEGKGLCRISTDDSLKITEICLKAKQSADENRVISM